MSAGAGAAREVTAERSVLTGQSRDARTSAPRGTSARPSREASAPAGIRVLPAGSGALLVELSSGEHAEAFHAELLRRRARGELPAVREIVPGARTVLLDGIADGSARLARELVSWEIPPLRRDTGEAVEIPVVYDGPDLADVAVAWGVTVADVPRIHAGTEFRVAFCGFAPASATSPASPSTCTCHAARLRAPGFRPVRWPSRGPTPGCTHARRPAAGRSSVGCPSRANCGTRPANRPPC